MTLCDLCQHQPPSVYCCSDSAFLCSDCDSHVHTANFLVARHVRLSLFHDHSSSSYEPSSSSSSSSSCESSSSSTKTTSATPDQINIDRKTRDVLVNWCTRLGVSSSSRVIDVACRHACKAWWVRPYRVALAASLWLGMGVVSSVTKDNDHENWKRRITVVRSTLLKRLEEISGVPAKSIVVAAGMLKTRRGQHQHVDESSAES